MTYNVFGGTLNPTLLLCESRLFSPFIRVNIVYMSVSLLCQDRVSFYFLFIYYSHVVIFLQHFCYYYYFFTLSINNPEGFGKKLIEK